MHAGKQIADTVVDIISEKNIGRNSAAGQKYRKGVFLEKKYINSRTTLKNRNILITERYLLDMIKEGKKDLKIPDDAIITPLARMLIDENKIRIRN